LKENPASPVTSPRRRNMDDAEDEKKFLRTPRNNQKPKSEKSSPREKDRKINTDKKQTTQIGISLTDSVTDLDAEFYEIKLHETHQDEPEEYHEESTQEPLHEEKQEHEKDSKKKKKN